MAAIQRQTVQYAADPGIYTFYYLLYLPPGYSTNPATVWPLMIFLHGAGERGTNIEAVTAHGPPMLIEQGWDYPCVVVSPQCAGGSWSSFALEAFIDDLLLTYRIDPDRIYVTGLSMGGYATWDLAVRHPEMYAAVVPVCGAGNPSLAYRLRDLPLWAFHGALDPVVPVSGTLDMIEAIRKAGGNPLVTIYPDLGHDVWTVTYINNGLYNWLFDQRRPSPPAVTQQPLSLTVTFGQSAAFTITATGTPAPTYQWQRSTNGGSTWTNLTDAGTCSGTTTTKLTVNSSTVSMSGNQFRCVVSNGAPPDATSDAAILTVNKAVPAITWATPAPITYGTPLSAAQLNATASVPGTFVYSPAAGTVLTANTRTLQATFKPTDAVNYATVSTTRSLVVNKAVPVITWATPAPITYGTPLSATQLNATASVPGTFVYSPAAGTVLTANTRTLQATFTPTDAVNYATVSTTRSLVVNKAIPVITWATPAPITYGTPLSAAQLNATASVPGTFVYSPAAGTVLTANIRTLSVKFTPADTADYTKATATQKLLVMQVVAVITWATPAPITYGTPLSSAQLNATANVPGTFVYSPAAGTVLTANIRTLSVKFTPADATDYATATATQKLVVNKVVPVITWATPAPITYGTPLSSAQLNATANVPGTFVYSPAAGTVLTANIRTLSVRFTPADTTDYATATATRSLTVNSANQQTARR